MTRNVLIAIGLMLVLATSGAASADARCMPQDPKPAQAAPAPAPINLNAATVADLEKLPGVGPATAARIIEYRQKSGGFKKVEELMNVKGIGEKSFLKLKTLVAVVPPKSTER